MNKSELLLIAEQGNPQAQYELGLYFVTPNEGEIDVDKAFFWFSKSANQGFADAQYRLGNFYETIKSDITNAILWYKAAAEQGHIEAQSTLGYCFECGHGVEENAIEAVKWHKKAAEQGNAIAQSNLARCYEQGRGIDRNLSEAIKWYEASAECGYHIQGVLNDLGVFYLTGNGVEIDESKAVYWLSKAVENDEIPSFANLGRCYLLGIGVNKDLAKALRLFSIAIRRGIEDIEGFLFEHICIDELTALANSGNAQAEYFLSRCYISGSFFQFDVTKAIDLLDSSVQKGEPLSMVILGCIYSEGKYVVRNLFKAEELFAKASEHGHKKAEVFLNEARMLIHFHVPYYLVKVTAKEFAEKLLDGEVFMRSISWFVPFERWSRDKSQPYMHKPSVDDSMEGFTKSLGGKPNPLGHWVNESGEPINDGFRKSGLIDMLLLREKIYCLFALEYDESKDCFVKPDAKMRDFGDTAVVITDPDEFLKRVINAVKQRFCDIDYYLAFRRVSYDVDLDSSDVYNEFHKTKAYADQKEFRIALDLTEGHIDKQTLDSATDFAVMQYLDSNDKVGMGRAATVPLTEDEKVAYKERRFRDIIKVDKNPDSLRDNLTLEIGDIRDIAIALPIEQFLEVKGADLFAEKGFKPPQLVAPFVPPRQPKPTFFKEIAQLSEQERNRIHW
jgi:TPR repeat protein